MIKPLCSLLSIGGYNENLTNKGQIAMQLYTQNIIQSGYGAYEGGEVHELPEYVETHNDFLDVLAESNLTVDLRDDLQDRVYNRQLSGEIYQVKDTDGNLIFRAIVGIKV